jgi:hypothetical protein
VKGGIKERFADIRSRRHSHRHDHRRQSAHRGAIAAEAASMTSSPKPLRRTNSP